MGLNEDLGDRENVGSAAVATQRAREQTSKTSAVCLPGKTWKLDLSSNVEARQLKIFMEYLYDNGIMGFKETMEKYGTWS